MVRVQKFDLIPVNLILRTPTDFIDLNVSIKRLVEPENITLPIFQVRVKESQEE